MRFTSEGESAVENGNLDWLGWPELPIFAVYEVMGY